MSVMAVAGDTPWNLPDECPPRKFSVHFYLFELPLSEAQLVTELDDAYEITATVVDTAMLEWWLRGFGDSIVLVCKLTLPNTGSAQ